MMTRSVTSRPRLARGEDAIVVDCSSMSGQHATDHDAVCQLLTWVEKAPVQHVRVLLPSSGHSPLARIVQKRLLMRGICVTQRQGY